MNRRFASLREWLGVARRRSNLKIRWNRFAGCGLRKFTAFAERIPETLGALAFYYRAIRARQKREVLRNMTSLDLDNERARFVTADETLKKRQRGAVRMKLLKTRSQSAVCAGPRRGWTDLQCLRNEFTKQAKHLPIRRLLSRSGAAVQAMKPCFMMSPLSLAKFLPFEGHEFRFLVIDEASQMKPEDSPGGLLRAEESRCCRRSESIAPVRFFFAVSRLLTKVERRTRTKADDINAESILDWSLKTFYGHVASNGTIGAAVRA